MFNPESYLDIYDFYFNEVIGDVFLGIVIGLIIVWLLTIRAKMPYQLSILFGLLWLAIVFSETQLPIIWTFIGLVVGGLFYYTMAKIFTRT